jgi:hypothetical protein
LAAVKLRGKTPLVLGVPPRVPVLLPLFVKVIPLGRLPVSDRLGAGKPVVTIPTELAVPINRVAEVVLVIAGV